MKQFIIALVVVALAAPFAMAQGFGFGAHLGGGLAMYDGMEYNATTGMYDETTQSKPGFHVGLSGEYPINDKIVVNANLGYAYFLVDDEEGEGYSMSTTLNDIYVEVDGNYYFNDNFYGLAGLGIHNYTVKFETEVDLGAWGGVQTFETDDSEMKFGFDLGVGYDFNEKMSLEAKYGLISDISQLKVTFAYMFSPARR